MTAALMWKEWREQGFVVITLLLAGCALLGGTAIMLDPPGQGNVTNLRNIWVGGRLALFLMTLTTGLVVGASLFAAERESGTFSFLEMLPCSRWSIWWRKVGFGIFLMVFPVTAYVGTAFAVGILGQDVTALGWILLIIVLALIAFGWGAFGSVFGKTSMAACGIGLVGSAFGAFLASVVGAVVLFVIREVLGIYIAEEGIGQIATIGLVTFFTIFFVPLFLSALLFTAPDRGRHLRSLDVEVPTLGEARRKTVRRVRSLNPLNWTPGLRRLLWLCRRQLLLQVIVSAILALILGMILTLPEVSTLLIYPIPTLIVGVVAGVTLWSDEQRNLSLRFWPERRLPLGRLWLFKTLSGLALLLMSLIVIVIPLIVRAIYSEERGPFAARVIQSGLYSDPAFPHLQYLFLWGLYGFAFGNLFGLLFRKGIVAGAVSLMVAGTTAGVWFPSCVMGGLSSWQWLLPLTVTFALGRFLIWPAATDRLASRGTILRMVFGFLMMLVTIAGGLTYRAFSEELVPEHDDDLQFAQTIPTFDLEQPGRDLRRAYPMVEDIESRSRNIVKPVLFPNDPQWQPIPGQDGDLGWRGGMPGGPPAFQPFPPAGVIPNPPQPANPQPKPAVRLEPFFPQLLTVIQRGMPTNRPDFTEWLDTVCTGIDDKTGLPGAAEWERLLSDAAKKPVGVFDDPNEIVVTAGIRYTGKLLPVFRLYLVRGLQLQQRGEPEDFVKRLEITFKLMQTVRNKTFLGSVSQSYIIEAEAIIALDRWLEGLRGHPELLARVRKVLQDRIALPEPLLIDSHLANQTVIRNSFKVPNQWISTIWAQQGLGRFLSSASPVLEVEANAYAFAVLVPWESARLYRLISQGNSQTPLVATTTPRPPKRFSEVAFRVVAGWVMNDAVGTAFQGRANDPLRRTIQTQALLKVALREHEANRGRFPQKLAELVDQGILPTVPNDPFDPNNAFRYRLSTGEKIEQIENEANDFPRRFGMGAGGPGGPGGAGFGGMPGGDEPNERLLNFEPFSAVAGLAAGVDEFNWNPAIDAPILQMLQQRAEQRRVTVRKNQPILWSVGNRGGDDSGTRNALDRRYRSSTADGDFVFIVPLPAPDPTKR